MSSLDLYNSKQRQNKQSRADLATSWRTSYPSNSDAYTFNSQTFSGTRMEHFKSIWTGIPNVEPSRLSSSFYGERQGNTDAENSSQLNDNNNGLIQFFSSLNYYAQEENKPLLAQTLPTGDVEQPLLDLGQVNNPWSQASNSVNNQENDIPEFTWSQIVSGDTKNGGLDSSGTLAETEDTLINNTSNNRLVRYISDSFFTASLNGIPVFTAIPTPKPYTVLKIQNIPWYSSINDIKKILSKDFNIPPVKEHPLSIHMLMDRCTGKTCGVAFAEVISKSRDEFELKDMLSRLERIPLQGRRLRIHLSSYDELREKLFYDWPGEFKNGVAVISSRDEDKNPNLFIRQKDFQNIQNVCRNFKLCYNRKCPERSFEYLMSIVMNIPWLQTKAVVTWQRDLMYENYKLATDTLRSHISKPLHTIDDGLLSLFVRAALLCDGFTIKQKLNILKTSRMNCPEDLLNHITEAEPEESISSAIYNLTI